MTEEDYYAASEPTDKDSNYVIVSFPGDQIPKRYQALVFSKWLRSLRYGNEFYKLADPDAYYKAYHLYIENILKQGACRLRLAILEDYVDVVLGFAVHRGPILDYVHVHKDQRNLGIGTKLVPDGINTITHLTRTGMSIWNKNRYKHLIFNPFA